MFIPFRDAHKYPYKHIGRNQHPKKLCQVDKKKIKGMRKPYHIQVCHGEMVLNISYNKDILSERPHSRYAMNISHRVAADTQFTGVAAKSTVSRVN